MMCIHSARSPSVRIAASATTFAACLFQDHPHSLQCGAGADHIIHNHHFFILDQLAVFFIQDQNLRLTSCDRKRFCLERVTHVRLVRFTQNHVWFLCLNRERIRQRNGLGFRCHENIIINFSEVFYRVHARRLAPIRCHLIYSK